MHLTDPNLNVVNLVATHLVDSLIDTYLVVINPATTHLATTHLPHASCRHKNHLLVLHALELSWHICLRLSLKHLAKRCWDHGNNHVAICLRTIRHDSAVARMHCILTHPNTRFSILIKVAADLCAYRIMRERLGRALPIQNTLI